MNEYLRKKTYQNSIHIYSLRLSDVYRNFFHGRTLKGLGLRNYGLGLEGPGLEGWGLGLKILALTTSLQLTSSDWEHG